MVLSIPESILQLRHTDSAVLSPAAYEIVEIDGFSIWFKPRFNFLTNEYSLYREIVGFSEIRARYEVVFPLPVPSKLFMRLKMEYPS